MRIMIAVDASRHSDEAVKFLTRMRWPPGSRMIVVSVVPYAGPMSVLAAMPVGASGPSAGPVEPTGTAIDAATAISRAENLLRSAGFSAHGRVLEGDPAEAIVALAQDERVDLIVVGSHGRTGLARLLMGSVSSHVTIHAPCTVLVVKVPDEFGHGRGSGLPPYSLRTMPGDPTVP